MKCAVGRCKQNNIKTTVSFYSFPKDPVQRNVWIKFCNRWKPINVGKEKVCALHFKQDDFERNLKFEMGFSCQRKRNLKPGAVPTVESGAVKVRSKIGNTSDMSNQVKIPKMDIVPMTTDIIEDNLLETKRDVFPHDIDMLKTSQNHSKKAHDNHRFHKDEVIIKEEFLDSAINLEREVEQFIAPDNHQLLNEAIIIKEEVLNPTNSINLEREEEQPAEQFKTKMNKVSKATNEIAKNEDNSAKCSEYGKQSEKLDGENYSFPELQSFELLEPMEQLNPSGDEDESENNFVSDEYEHSETSDRNDYMLTARMEAKRQCSTKRSQYNAMVQNMKKHPDIATNMTKRHPEAYLPFWDSLMVELNNLGPPCRSVRGWKKVWTDYKSAIKKKLAHNKRKQNANGGGQNTQKFLSSLEEEVVQITAMHTIVDGIPNVASLGVPARARNEGDYTAGTFDDVASTSRSVESINVDIEVEHTNKEVKGPGDETSTQQKSNRESKQIRLLEKQIKVNEEHLEKYVKLTEETNASLKKISENLEKLHDDAKTSNELFRGFMTDMRNHFAFMQKVAIEQKMLDIKLRKLNELEKLKK